jgi:hypothetical protein
METPYNYAIKGARQLDSSGSFDQEDGGPTTQMPAAGVPPHPFVLLRQTSSNLHG